MIPKWFFRHAEVPRDLKEWKIPTSKFGHFLPYLPYPPLQKIRYFGPPTNIHEKDANRISVSESVPWDTFLGLPRDRGQGNSLQKTFWWVKQNFFVMALFLYLKIIPKWFPRHAEVPRDLNEWKMPTSKFGHFLPYLPYPPLQKIRYFGPPTNIHEKGANRISVS